MFHLYSSLSKEGSLPTEQELQEYLCEKPTFVISNNQHCLKCKVHYMIGKSSEITSGVNKNKQIAYCAYLEVVL